MAELALSMFLQIKASNSMTMWSTILISILLGLGFDFSHIFSQAHLTDLYSHKGKHLHPILCFKFQIYLSKRIFLIMKHLFSIIWNRLGNKTIYQTVKDTFFSWCCRKCYQGENSEGGGGNQMCLHWRHLWGGARAMQFWGLQGKYSIKQNIRNILKNMLIVF